jgi:hypothetical protein
MAGAKGKAAKGKAAKGGPVPMLVTYRPKKGSERALEALVRAHGPTLRRLGLSVGGAARVWRATDIRTGATWFVESFSWRDADASDAAHRTPEVLAIWEPMGALLETMELARAEPLAP